ncbi:MAG: ERF family protein [Patescibacteria group bacterium]|nr:ERF family protein [Patescibacteria group bacterium]
MTDHKNLAEALCAAQGELTNVEQDGRGNYGKYATLPALINAVRPVLREHGLSWSALPAISEQGQPAMRYRLQHVSGEVLEEIMALCMTKQDAQAQGSALTYARRYALQGVLNIGAEDDDGQTATDAQGRAQQPVATLAPLVELAAASDVDELKAIASGQQLTGRQIKLALGAAGLSVPDELDSEVFARVPKSSVADLAAALSQSGAAA